MKKQTQVEKVLEHLQSGLSITVTQMRTQYKIMSGPYVISQIKKRNPWLNIVSDTINVRGHKNVARYRLEMV
jgi:hypothetical protein